MSAAPRAALLEAQVHPVPTAPDEPSDLCDKAAGQEIQRVDEALARALVEQDPEASAEEKLLHRLLAAEQPILDELNRAKLELAVTVHAALDDPNRAFRLAKVLREIVAVAAAVNKRQTNVVGALASLRAQRHLLCRSERGR